MDGSFLSYRHKVLQDSSFFVLYARKNNDALVSVGKQLTP